MFKKSILALLGLAYINSQCTENQIGNLCLTDQEVQDCHDHLDKLAADTEENPSISNECFDRVVGDRTRYDFVVSYNDGYFHNADCNTQEISFEGTKLTKGSGDLDQWEFDSDNQQITFSIEHDALENYGCVKVTNPDEYIWQCEMALDIKFGGYTQLTYGFHITIILSRVYENTLDITVKKNEVTGDCCENILEIETELNFCEDLQCSTGYLPNGQTVERKQNIFVEHSIVSPEFDYYYLHRVQIKLGPFIPDIIRTSQQSPAKLVYQFQSNIALPNMQLEVISRIDEQPEADLDNTRRMLANDSEIGEEYRVKATGMISVEEFMDKQKELENEKSDNAVLIGVIAGVSSFLLLTIVAGAIYMLKFRSKKQEQTNEQKYQDNALSVSNRSSLSVVGRSRSNSNDYNA